MDMVQAWLKFKLNKDEMDFAFRLTKSQMEEVYNESGYGWDDADKRRELTEDGTRFLLVREVPAADAKGPGKLIAFAHFRFTVQGMYRPFGIFH